MEVHYIMSLTDVDNWTPALSWMNFHKKIFIFHLMDNTSVSFSSSQKRLIYAAAFATMIYKQSWKYVSRKNLAYLNYICGAGELLGLNS